MGGQFLNPVKAYENYANWEEERTEIINRISEERITGVIFLSGDRHFSEVTKLPRYGSYDLHDFTISPLTSHLSTPHYQLQLVCVIETCV